jgi:hypothetical protein
MDRYAKFALHAVGRFDEITAVVEKASALPSPGHGEPEARLRLASRDLGALAPSPALPHP